MKYYSVGEITITDRSWLRDYVAAVTGLVERHGGRYLARTTRFEKIEGDRPAGKLFLIIEWPSRAAAETFYDSDEYRPYRERRTGGARSEFVLVAGEDINRVAPGEHFIRDFDWMLSCTAAFESTVAFVRDVLGLEIVDEGLPRTDTQFTRYACAALPSRRTLEIVEPGQAAERLRGRQILCLRARDIVAARRELERRGAVFVSDVIDDGEGMGWIYLLAPDGNVFQVYGSTGGQECGPAPADY